MTYCKYQMHLTSKTLLIFAAIVLCVSVFCMTGCSGGATSSGKEFDIKVNISGNAYDKATSTQAIVYIQQIADADGNAVNEKDSGEYALFYLNEEKTIEVPASGTYAVEFVSPINSDGSIYKMPEPQKVSVTSDEPGKLSETATLISADAVDAVLMQEVIDTINAVYNATDDKDVKKQMESMLSLMEKNVEASPTAEAVNTENTGSTKAAEQMSRTASASADNGNNSSGNGSNGYTSDSSSGSGSNAGNTSGFDSGNTSGQESGSGESGGASGGNYEDFQDHHAHEWEYYTALEYVGTYVICNQCGAQVSDSASHNCTGAGCSFHTEDVYDEHPVRTCWCGATEYL